MLLNRASDTPDHLVPEECAVRERREPMAKFVIAPHMRLQEWVAEEKGYLGSPHDLLKIVR